MHFITKGKTQSIVLGSREVACLLAFSLTDEKIPTLNGASFLLEDNELTAYASDGKKSVRGQTALDGACNWERYTWIIPRAYLLLASNVLEDGQEAHFPLHGSRCALNGFERWRIATGGEDSKEDWHEFGQPVPANTQMGLPFEAIDSDVEGSSDAECPADVKYSAHSLNALRKLALAGLTPNLKIDIRENGLLHAITDGGTQWHAVIRPVSLEASTVEDDEEQDDSLDEEGKLELQPSEKRKRGRPKGSKSKKRNGKARLDLV